MKRSKGPKSCQYEVFESKRGHLIVQFYGHMDSSNAACMIQEITSQLERGHYISMKVDLEKVTYLDDFGALILVELKDRMITSKGHFEIINASGRIQEVLSILHFESLGRRITFTKPRKSGIFVRLGEATLGLASDLKYLIYFLGSVCMAMIYIVFHPGSLRTDDTFWYMQKTGVDALPIVALISFLLGLIMAFMSSIQLKEFGANIYVASLVSLAMARELGPIMTAIIVAGRSGSAFAAEIGSMKVNEEIDALFTMGFDTTRFLVVPKMIAKKLAGANLPSMIKSFKKRAESRAK